MCVAEVLHDEDNGEMFCDWCCSINKNEHKNKFVKSCHSMKLESAKKYKQSSQHKYSEAAQHVSARQLRLCPNGISRTGNGNKWNNFSTLRFTLCKMQTIKLLFVGICTYWFVYIDHVEPKRFESWWPKILPLLLVMNEVIWKSHAISSWISVSQLWRKPSIWQWEVARKRWESCKSNKSSRTGKWKPEHWQIQQRTGLTETPTGRHPRKSVILNLD